MLLKNKRAVFTVLHESLLIRAHRCVPYLYFYLNLYPFLYLHENLNKNAYERLTCPSFVSTEDVLFDAFRFGGDVRETMILNECNGA